MSGETNSLDANVINLRVAGEGDNTVVHFKVKKGKALKKLMSAYCERLGIDHGGVTFQYGDADVLETDTPAGLGMEEADTIKATLAEN